MAWLAFFMCLTVVIVSIPGYVNAELGRAAMLNSSMAKDSFNLCGPRPSEYESHRFYVVVNGAEFDYENACGMEINVTCTAAPDQPNELCLAGNTNFIIVTVIGWTHYQADKTIVMHLAREVYEKIVDPKANPNNAKSVTVNYRILNSR